QQVEIMQMPLIIAYIVFNTMWLESIEISDGCTKLLPAGVAHIKFIMRIVFGTPSTKENNKRATILYGSDRDILKNEEEGNMEQIEKQHKYIIEAFQLQINLAKKIKKEKLSVQNMARVALLTAENLVTFTRTLEPHHLY
ncbi:hypothetical protein ACJX0J_033618, partial [Zea mays]